MIQKSQYGMTSSSICLAGNPELIESDSLIFYFLAVKGSEGVREAFAATSAESDGRTAS